MSLSWVLLRGEKEKAWPWKGALLKLPCKWILHQFIPVKKLWKFKFNFKRERSLDGIRRG